MVERPDRIPLLLYLLGLTYNNTNGVEVVAVMNELN
jgi:hypothetical protein